MRKVLLLALTGALLVAMAASTATAKEHGSGKSKAKSKGPATVTYVFEGTMASIAEDGSPFKITVTEGKNKAARDAVKESLESGDVEPLSLIVDPETTKVELNGQEASLADLKAGDEVIVQAKAPKGETSFTARVISAERAEEPTESAPAEGESSG